jgi:acetylornithine deacetylase
MQQVVDDLARLVAFPTVSNRPVTELAAFVAHRLEDLGFSVELIASPTMPDKCNLVATAGPRDTEGLVLSGHMDVVPTEGQPWTTDPFVVTERAGRLYGRGTADMKGFLAATLAALEQVPVRSLDRELTLIWTHDEEVGCLGSAQLAEILRARGRRLPRACLIGEPTDFQVLRMHPGHVTFEVLVTGEAAHSSRPDLGRNAIETAADAIVVLRQLAAELRLERRDDLPMFAPWVPMNTGCIHGGSAVNIVPDCCRVEVGYRPLPGMPAHEVFERARARLLSELAHAPCQVEVRQGRSTPALLTAAGTDLAALLAPHAVPGAEAAPFATDGGNLARLDTSPLVFGPGSIDVAHKADEYVHAEALARTVPMLVDLVQRRCLTP